MPPARTNCLEGGNMSSPVMHDTSSAVRPIEIHRALARQALPGSVSARRNKSERRRWNATCNEGQ